MLDSKSNYDVLSQETPAYAGDSLKLKPTDEHIQICKQAEEYLNNLHKSDAPEIGSQEGVGRVSTNLANDKYDPVSVHELVENDSREG